MSSKKFSLAQLLTAAALFLLVLVYFVPIWWVSLSAPNYPKDAFPDGIRIHFSFTGVSNGCSVTKGARKDEVYQGDLGDNPAEERSRPVGKDAGVDCVHEMDTINHYVGMYPIATGAPVEQKFSKYVVAIFAVMLAAFFFRERKKQLLILGAGFVAVTAWMGVELFGLGGAELIVRNYQDALGHYFKDMDKIAAWGQNLKAALNLVAAGLVAVMLLLLVGVAVSRRFSLLLAVVPALIPAYFIGAYAAWLWFFGHHLHPWGAFTLKPFMPTVFGEGKVAQFSTYSYPYFGFGMLVLIMGALLLAALLRAKELRQEAAAK